MCGRQCNDVVSGDSTPSIRWHIKRLQLTRWVKEMCCLHSTTGRSVVNFTIADRVTHLLASIAPEEAAFDSLGKPRMATHRMVM